MTSSKLRILCLHGYTQNATMFRKKTAVARKSIDDLADFGKDDVGLSLEILQ